MFCKSNWISTSAWRFSVTVLTTIRINQHHIMDPNHRGSRGADAAKAYRAADANIVVLLHREMVSPWRRLLRVKLLLQLRLQRSETSRSGG